MLCSIASPFEPDVSDMYSNLVSVLRRVYLVRNEGLAFPRNKSDAAAWDRRKKLSSNSLQPVCSFRFLSLRVLFLVLVKELFDIA